MGHRSSTTLEIGSNRHFELTALWRTNGRAALVPGLAEVEVAAGELAAFSADDVGEPPKLLALIGRRKPGNEPLHAGIGVASKVGSTTAGGPNAPRLRMWPSLRGPQDG